VKNIKIFGRKQPKTYVISNASLLLKLLCLLFRSRRQTSMWNALDLNSSNKWL